MKQQITAALFMASSALRLQCIPISHQCHDIMHNNNDLALTGVTKGATIAAIIFTTVMLLAAFML